MNNIKKDIILAIFNDSDSSVSTFRATDSELETLIETIKNNIDREVVRLTILNDNGVEREITFGDLNNKEIAQ